MKRPLSEIEKRKPYAKYFDLPFEMPSEEEYRILEHELPMEEVLPIEDAVNFVLGGDHFKGAPNGYRILPDGRSYTANTKVVKGITLEMNQWWFQWLNTRPKGIPHELGNLKYKIWCPLDHWDHGYQIDGDPTSGSRICESLDLGAGDEPQYMRGKGGFPSAFGVTDEMLEKAESEGRHIGFGWGFDDDGNPTGVSMNQFRVLPEGVEWSSRAWGGYTYEDGKLVKYENFKPRTAESCRNELLHNFAEQEHLPKILVPLYETYHDRPLDDDE